MSSKTRIVYSQFFIPCVHSGVVVALLFNLQCQSSSCCPKAGMRMIFYMTNLPGKFFSFERRKPGICMMSKSTRMFLFVVPVRENLFKTWYLLTASTLSESNCYVILMQVTELWTLLSRTPPELKLFSPWIYFSVICYLLYISNSRYLDPFFVSFESSR